MTEAQHLYDAWVKALAKRNETDADADYDAEQDAYDRLVDYVEENDLVYSEFDPRGLYGSRPGEE